MESGRAVTTPVRPRRGVRAPIDRSRPYVCETVTPLYYTRSYAELSPSQVLRYNQIAAIHFNEVICFFERSVAEHALDALMKEGKRSLPGDLAQAVVQFADEERAHTRMFRALNRIAEPEWYLSGDEYIIQSKRTARWLFSHLTRRPWTFPVSILLMLIMEEKSLEVSRRMIRAGEDVIEPHFLETYRAHLEDEVRHVRIDGRLLLHLFEGRSRFIRRGNAALFRFLLTRCFLLPDQSAFRVVELLAKEQPEVVPLLPRIKRELQGLAGNAKYHAMMFSRHSCPLAFGLFDRFSEFRKLSEGLLSYTPSEVGGRI